MPNTFLRQSKKYHKLQC